MLKAPFSILPEGVLCLASGAPSLPDLRDETDRPRAPSTPWSTADDGMGGAFRGKVGYAANPRWTRS